MGIDADNASADIIEPLLEKIAKYGVASVKRIYGDWSNGNLKNWREVLLPHAIILIQQFSYTKGKNATDMAMVIDAMDLLYSRIFDGFCYEQKQMAKFTEIRNLREAVAFKFIKTNLKENRKIMKRITIKFFILTDCLWGRINFG